MKLALATGATLVALSLAAAAQAQPPNNNKGHQQQKAAPQHAQGNSNSRGQGNNQSRGQGNNQYRGQGNRGQGNAQYYRGGAQGYRGNGNGNYQGQARGYYGNNRGYNGGYRGGAIAHSFRAERRFQLSPRYEPRGWYARQWGYGEYLPYGWFAPDFYLAWDDYGLPPPPPGTQWVQEGSDAVLVDLSTGEVLSVEQGVFY